MESKKEYNSKIEKHHEVFKAYCDGCHQPKMKMKQVGVPGSIAHVHYCEKVECRSFVMNGIQEIYNAMKTPQKPPEMEEEDFDNYTINILETLQDTKTMNKVKYFQMKFEEMVEKQVLTRLFPNSYNGILVNFAVWISLDPKEPTCKE